MFSLSCKTNALFELCFSILFGNFLLLYLLTKNDGKRSDPGNYRPISLLPIMSKIFESFVNDRISNYLEGTGLWTLG